MRCCEECRPSNFGLNHPEPAKFVAAEWPGHHALYLTWRWLMALFFLAIVIFSAFDSGDPDVPVDERYLVFLTDWSIVLFSAALLLDAITASMGSPGSSYAVLTGCRRPIARADAEAEAGLSCWLRATWLLNNTAYAFTLGVCIAFWGLIVGLGGVTPVAVSFISIATHALPVVYLIINIFVTAMPMRVLHFIYPVILGIIYLVFSIIYTVSGGTNYYDKPFIYAVLDWNNEPGWSTVYGIIVCFVLLPACHFILYGLYRLRVFIASRCCPGRWTDKTRGEINMVV